MQSNVNMKHFFKLDTLAEIDSKSNQNLFKTYIRKWMTNACTPLKFVYKALCAIRNLSR